MINGFWLQPGGGPGSGGCVNYVTDTAYRTSMLDTIVGWVNTYKNHPGVLLWNVGNESILGMQNCFSGAELERQRVAYAQYVNEVAGRIHAADPNHPVTSTDAWTGAWAYLKTHAPELDLYAVNSYGAGCDVQRDWVNGGYTKPYILTEAGPAGEWEVPDDANGVPAEPTDTQKRDGYTTAWNCITRHTGVALGGTLFHYGLEDDFGGVWFGGQAPANTPPVISGVSLSRTTDVPAGGQFTIDVNASDPDGDAIGYQVKFNSKYLDNSSALQPASFTGSGGRLTVTAPQRLGVWKVYVYARDGHGNVGIEARSVRVVAPPVGGTNLALGRPATASSHQTGGDGAPFPPERATDGNTATRWASDWSDPQWIQVDLGQVSTVDHVQLVWEAAHARAYQIQISDDATTWRTLYTTTSGDGGADDIDVSGSGRYVRMYGTQRATGYGYSLYEFGVYRR